MSASACPAGRRSGCARRARGTPRGRRGLRGARFIKQETVQLVQEAGAYRIELDRPGAYLVSVERGSRRNGFLIDVPASGEQRVNLELPRGMRSYFGSKMMPDVPGGDESRTSLGFGGPVSDSDATTLRSDFLSAAGSMIYPA